MIMKKRILIYTFLFSTLLCSCKKSQSNTELMNQPTKSEISETEISESETQETETLTPEELLMEYKSLDATTIVDVQGFTESQINSLFYSCEIDDNLFERIYGKSYKEDCTVGRDSLTYLRMLYKDLDGNTHIGEMIVNQDIKDDVIEIFKELYWNNYPIEKMVLIDEYNADDNLSMADNNTSSFNYRVVEGTTKLSKHSQGLAIDINPRYNPYIHKLNGETVISPENGTEFADRSLSFEYKIDKSDLAYKLFIEHGFTWGGDWNSSKDYQHFQKEF